MTDDPRLAALAKAIGPRCVKCGAVDIHTRWEPSILECGWSGQKMRRGRETEFAGEHLHRTCRGCAYEWADHPNDWSEHD